ncbi:MULTISPECIES: cytochrome P450 [Alphaproteobacteria]|uniref:Cytochrome P450 hydroxylase n=2 Tax=Alphaproteobacteria TaxID=28211 RepID=A0A512HPS6_9HYPH|nr:MULTISPECIES: cytochrome P450 [Alphaproteobacteria]GEO87455.1 cytochrome P450 hydroxylase [Ciceribacter naphthalenivorans]GLR23413.1 cytochrome P450 hydroxylase [Ciceribacter naphthalenivorans]GLT06269.1 cytochrome P450 hydroxylase [Sphingomonas psychrolutea]
MTIPPYLTIDKGLRHVSLDARDPAFYNDPNRAYAALHAHCPTFYWEEQRQWFLTGYDHVNALLRDRRFGRQILHVATREELGMPEPHPHTRHFDAAEAHSLLELEPPDHTRLRTLVNRAFVSRHVEKMKPEIEELANRLIDGFEADRKVELLSSFADIIPVTMIARMIGIPDEMGPQLLRWSHDYVGMYMFKRSRVDEEAADRSAKEFSDYVRGMIAERRSSPRDDLLSHMIHTEHKGQYLTEDELISTTIVLLNAGHEATVHQIGNSVRIILESGLDTGAMFGDEQATARTVEETLRICAPVHIFDRYCLEPAEIDGVAFKRGDKVGMILAAANLDPSKYPNPLTFKPERNEAPNLSFGAGIHFCIGAPLARLELNIVLPLLFRRLPGLKIARTPAVKDVYHFHGLERLDLAW